MGKAAFLTAISALASVGFLPVAAEAHAARRDNVAQRAPDECISKKLTKAEAAKRKQSRRFILM